MNGLSTHLWLCNCSISKHGTATSYSPFTWRIRRGLTCVPGHGLSRRLGPQQGAWNGRGSPSQRELGVMGCLTTHFRWRSNRLRNKLESDGFVCHPGLLSVHSRMLLREVTKPSGGERATCWKKSSQSTWGIRKQWLPPCGRSQEDRTLD